MNEGHFDHASEILGGLLETREDAAAFLKPADQTLHDVALSICLTAELDGPSISIFVFLGGDDRNYFQVQQAFVDPIRPVCFVPSERDWPCDRLSLTIQQNLVGAIEYRNQGGTVVGLSWCQLEVERMPLPIAQQMDFCGITPARTASCVIFGLFRVPFSAPCGTAGGTDARAINAPEILVDFPSVDLSGLQPTENFIQGSIVVPLVEQIPHRPPRTLFFRQISPRRTSSHDPENTIDNHASISRWSSRCCRWWKNIRNGVPLFVRKPMPRHPSPPCSRLEPKHQYALNLRSRKYQFSDKT